MSSCCTCMITAMACQKMSMCSRKHYTDACRYNIHTSIGRRVFADNNGLYAGLFVVR